METEKIEIPVRKLRIEELSGEEKQWMDAAVAAAGQAYAPYSGFRVGAVVVLANGMLVTGNNQENAAYPSGLCAERVALFSASAHYPDIPVTALALAAVREGAVQPYIAPCGACRQVLLETEQRFNYPVRLLLCGCEAVRIVDSAASLLPLAFGNEGIVGK
ncbi:MAG: cytidine deaminase [Tannerella sp.]|jgi:cytidine deaminase|nr:cytidine deaminase [Tannerella sp.]